MISTQDILVKKFFESTLAPLYILYFNEDFNPSQWIKEFSKKTTGLEEHPDVVVLDKNENENNYKVNSTATLRLNQEIVTNPIQLSKKLIFISDAQDISDTVANKLLKIFEELNSKYCIFLLCPENSAILPTVLSRSVKINIDTPKIQKNDNLDEIIQFDSPFEFAREIKQNPNTAKNIEKKFIEQKIGKILQNTKNDIDSYLIIESTLKHLEQLENQLNFNNSKLHSIAAFFK